MSKTRLSKNGQLTLVKAVKMFADNADTRENMSAINFKRTHKNALATTRAFIAKQYLSKVETAFIDKYICHMADAEYRSYVSAHKTKSNKLLKPLMAILGLSALTLILVIFAGNVSMARPQDSMASGQVIEDDTRDTDNLLRVISIKQCEDCNVVVLSDRTGNLVYKYTDYDRIMQMGEYYSTVSYIDDEYGFYGVSFVKQDLPIQVIDVSTIL